MEQVLHTFGIDWKILLFQSANFGLVLLVLWRFLYRPILRILDERRRAIEKGVKDAAEADLLKRRTEEERGGIIAAAGKEAERILAEGKKHTEEATGAMLLEARAKEERLLKEAKDKVAEEKRRMMEESKEEMARMAILAAERILRKQISK